MPRHPRRARAALLALLALLLTGAAAGCGSDEADRATGPGPGRPARTLRISAIPDQEPAKLAEIGAAMAEYLEGALDVGVEYVPVADYAASVSLFGSGDIDVAFFGGLTGTQARLRTPGATFLAQRDIDASFRSVFIASAATGLRPVGDVAGLSVVKGRRLTFGSETSTSGRLMPQYFLDQAGVAEADLAGPPGFSGSHDKTVDLVESGAYEVGALNAQVWKRRKAAGTVDLSRVVELFVTEPYHDYHWMAGPRTDERFGPGFTERVRTALLSLDAASPAHAKVLQLYGAGRFIPTDPANYREIEEIGRRLDLLRGG